NSLVSKITAAIFVTMVCLPPMIMAGRKISNKHRWAIMTGFAIIPLLYGMLYQRMILNRLLKNDVLSAVHFLGSPHLILVHTALLLIILLIFRKGLLQLEIS
ncbi:MAG TPA: hypothetical protein VHL77_09440, partial [Ferruginibacter sp.]|nr:hypothetical protein [Ferruginibacter sp.]